MTFSVKGKVTERNITWIEGKPYGTITFSMFLAGYNARANPATAYITTTSMGDVTSGVRVSNERYAEVFRQRNPNYRIHLDPRVSFEKFTIGN
jgi:hypothetical protein